VAGGGGRRRARSHRRARRRLPRRHFGVTLPTGPLHYDELDVRGAFHHSRAEVDDALDLLASGAVDWRALAGETIGLDDLAAALRRPATGEARKLVVDPSR
jgi:L-iditol 2-dehydrogenase